jgi:hypothetical protein
MLEQALDHLAAYARSQVLAVRTPSRAPDFQFSLSGAVVDVFAPPETGLVDWLSTTVSSLTSTPNDRQHRIICDADNAHRGSDYDRIWRLPLSDQQVEEALLRVGLQGRLNWDFGLCDFYDPALRLGLRLQAARDPGPIWESTAPMANFMGWIGRAEGYGMIHAATLGIGDMGCLILGEGGRGKSGTTLGGILNKLQTVGDDYVLVSLDAPYRAKPVYRSMKQDDAGLVRCGLAPEQFGSVNWAGKRVFSVDAVADGALRNDLALCAILLPRISGEARSQIVPARASEAFLAMMPSTLGQLSGVRAARYGEVANLVRDLPCYHLYAGLDPAEVTDTVRDLLMNSAKVAQ